MTETSVSEISSHGSSNASFVRSSVKSLPPTPTRRAVATPAPLGSDQRRGSHPSGRGIAQAPGTTGSQAQSGRAHGRRTGKKSRNRRQHERADCEVRGYRVTVSSESPDGGGVSAAAGLPGPETAAAVVSAVVLPPTPACAGCAPAIPPARLMTPETFVESTGARGGALVAVLRRLRSGDECEPLSPPPANGHSGAASPSKPLQPLYQLVSKDTTEQPIKISRVPVGILFTWRHLEAKPWTVGIPGNFQLSAVCIYFLRRLGDPIGRSPAGPNFSRSSFPALKNGTFLEGTWTTSPVLGLRPCRALRLRGRKLPKPRNSTLSPSLKASVIHVSRMLTMASTCLLVRWTSAATLAASPAFVMSPASPKQRGLYMDKTTWTKLPTICDDRADHPTQTPTDTSRLWDGTTLLLTNVAPSSGMAGHARNRHSTGIAPHIPQYLSLQ